jgi:nitrate/nitrite transport system substrate-binding protein
MSTKIEMKRSLNRRTFLKASAATATLISSLKAQLPFGANVAQAAGPEVTKATLGFIALTDAAPLFVAKEKGNIRQIRNAGRRGAEAGVLGCDARQHRGGL